MGAKKRYDDHMEDDLDNDLDADLDDDLDNDDLELQASDDNDSDDEDFSETVVLDAKKTKTDNVGEASVEIDVESLVAEFEAEASHGVDSSGRIRKRLEALMERKRRHQALQDFADYDI